VDGVLEITIPLRFRPLRFLFATVLCLIWGVAVPIGIRKLITDPSSRLSNYLVAALFSVVWVVSEPMLLHISGTYLVGRDRVRVAVKEFGVRREAFGFGYWRRCPLKKVWEIQSVHNSMGGKAHLLALSNNRRFDFGHVSTPRKPIFSHGSFVKRLPTLRSMPLLE
jgi:hypothetical protein